MKRTSVALATMGGLLSLSAPASAVTEPDIEQFHSFTSVCTSGAEGRTCTNISLFAREDNVAGTTDVNLSIEQFTIVNGEVVSSSSEFGSVSSRAVSINTDRSLNVDLQPVTLSLDTCGPEFCRFSREVVVSASDLAVGPVTTSRSRTSTSDGNCRTTTTTEFKSAAIAGTITVDGVSYDESGGVQTEDARTSSRCK